MVQLPLIPPEPLAPLPVDSGHYVVALQNKPGELDALRRASDQAWERMTPLLHFVGRKSRGRPPTASTIRGWTAKAATAVGSHPFYIDVMRLGPTSAIVTPKGSVPVLQQIYASARKRQLRFVPVVWVGTSTPEHCRVVQNAALEDGHGLAMRLPIRTLVPPVGTIWRNYLEAQLTMMSSDVSDTDLIVDLKYLSPDAEVDADDLAALLKEMLAVGSWRGVAVLGTSIPSMLSCVVEGTVGSLPRREWRLWSQLGQCDLPRLPSFGDYAIQHPQPPQDGGGPGMRANIRYTTDCDTLIARGRGSVMQEGSAQYRLLCQWIVARAEFTGSFYSWGDSVIEQCARGTMAPGAQNVWRGAGTSHHLELVTDQLRRRQTGS